MWMVDGVAVGMGLLGLGQCASCRRRASGVAGEVEQVPLQHAPRTPSSAHTRYPAPPSEFGTCLGDLYSVAWMENADEADLTLGALWLLRLRCGCSASAVAAPPAQQLLLGILSFGTWMLPPSPSMQSRQHDVHLTPCCQPHRSC